MASSSVPQPAQPLSLQSLSVLTAPVPPGCPPGLVPVAQGASFLPGRAAQAAPSASPLLTRNGALFAGIINFIKHKQGWNKLTHRLCMFQGAVWRLCWPVSRCQNTSTLLASHWSSVEMPHGLDRDQSLPSVTFTPALSPAVEGWSL